MQPITAKSLSSLEECGGGPKVLGARGGGGLVQVDMNQWWYGSDISQTLPLVVASGDIPHMIPQYNCTEGNIKTVGQKENDQGDKEQILWMRY